MQIAVVSVLNFLSNPNTGEPLNLKDALCLFCGKVSRSTLCAEVLHQNFMRSYIFQVKHHWNMVTFTCCIAHPNAANTHFSHTKWNETNHYSQVSVVMRHNDSSRQGKKRNQFYWSAICGTNMQLFLAVWWTARFLGCLGTLWPTTPCTTLIVLRITHQQPALWMCQKLEWSMNILCT